MRTSRPAVVLGLAALVSSTPFVHADSINPWSFGVVSLGNIGSSANPYGSDFQGAAAVLGNAYFHGFSLHDVASVGPGTAYSLYAGGNVSIGGSINNGGVEAAGSVFVNGASIFGHVSAGGNLAGSSGTVHGNVNIAGTKTTGNPLTVNGSLTENTAFSPTLDLPALGSYFQNISQTLGATPSDNTITNQWGGLSVNLHPGVNVVSLSFSELNSAWGFTVNGPANSTLIVNVTGSHVTLNDTTWVYQGGISRDNVLLNFHDASTLNLTGGNIVNLLAPNAATNFPYGHIDGNLIVGSLTGSGQVNAGGFLPPDSTVFNQIPEPAAASLLALAALALLARRNRA